MGSRVLSRYFPEAPGIGSLPCRGFTNQIGLILEPVARDLGFTVLPRSARLAFQRPESIQVIEWPRLVEDTLWLIHLAEWPLSTRVKQVVATLRAQIKGL